MSDPLSVLRSRVSAIGSWRRVVQFASVGVVGAGIDTAVLILLVEASPLGPFWAKPISWEVGIAVIFFLNERWTFAGYGRDGRRRLLRRFVRSNVVRFGGLVVTLSVLTGLVYGVGVWYVAANVIGIGAGFVVNYTCESLITWRVHRS